MLSPVNKTGVRKLKKSITALKKRIKEHKRSIKNPYDKYPNWDEFDKARQDREIRHWETEIDAFEKQIQDNERMIHDYEEKRDRAK